MADYDLKYTGAQIDALLDAANELKTNGYIYKGVATPSTNPGTPSERVAYLASEPGTYTNFGGIVIASGLYSLTYAGGTWTGTQMQAGSDIDVVQTIGQSTTSVMSQKAVTDRLIDIQDTFSEDIMELKGVVGVATEFSLVGNNNTGVSKILHLEAGRQYKLSTSMTAADYSNSSIQTGINVYSLTKHVNGTSTNLFATYKGTDTVPSEYVFTAEEADDYDITIRANSGSTIDFELKCYDSNLLAGKKEHSSVSVDTDEFGFFNNGSGFRIYFGRKQRLDCYKFPVRVVVTGVPSGVICSLSTFENYSDTLNPYASNEVENPSWGTTDYTFSNPLSNYLKLNFKSTASGTNPKITDAQLASIKSDVRVSITSCIKLGGVHGENYDIAFEGGSLEEKVASLDIESTLQKKEMTLNDFFCSWSTYLGAFVKSRIICALAIPKMPIRVIISGVPSGFQASLGTNYSAADAFNQSVYSVEGYTWNILDCVFTIPAPYLCIGFRKVDTAYMDDEDMATIMESVRVTVSPWDDDINNADIITVNDKERTLRYLNNLRRPNYSLDGQYTSGLTPFTLLHFSDLHSDRINLKRIVEYKNFYSEYIDDAIGTGDLIRNKFDQSFDFWSEVGADNILISTGNHEYWNGSNYTTVTPLQVYNKYIAPYYESWGETVVFPTDADINGYSYYYKDYPTRNIRLFVLDCMANMNRNRDGVQAAWLATELENARVAGRHVICATHIGSTEETPYNNSFTSLRAVFDEDGEGLNSPSYAEFYTLRDAVDTFIGNDGKFVCWIAGHRHVDTVAMLNKQSGNEWVPTSQFSVHVATASGGEFATGSNAGHGDADTDQRGRNYNDGHSWWIIPRGDDCDRTDNTKQQDCFNIYSVDTEKQLLRIFRVGSDVDKNGRHKGSLLYDYANRQVLYCD